jgi:dTDP-4-dehydrorhamnose 3,5-epimerase
MRGLHFQKEPWAQAKLITVLRGAILDVIVDLRRNSPCFGRHFALKLSAAEGNQLFIPIGFAHGFLTLEPDTLLTYKVSNFYSPDHDTVIRFDDARLNIDWGVDPRSLVISDKDRNLPAFNPSADCFS